MILPINQGLKTRPKSPGLWLRILYKDGAILEGVHPHDLLLYRPEQGVTVRVSWKDTCGFSRVTTIHVPRCVIQHIEVLAVIGHERWSRDVRGPSLHA